MYSDDDMIMISALQHYAFCPRQCALIHLEQVWSENYLTASGQALHSHVDANNHETRRDIHKATSVRLASGKYGICGITDMLEYHKQDSNKNEYGEVNAVKLKGLFDYWRPFPVEYKHGKPKEHDADRIQLCAQALCLEEMLSVTIREGALFYAKTRRREDVVFDNDLREKTISIINSIRLMIENRITPAPEFDSKCNSCSLIAECKPSIVRKGCVKEWLNKEITKAIGDKSQ